MEDAKVPPKEPPKAKPKPKAKPATKPKAASPEISRMFVPYGMTLVLMVCCQAVSLHGMKERNNRHALCAMKSSVMSTSIGNNQPV